MPEVFGFHNGQLILNAKNVSKEFNRIELGKDRLQLYLPQFGDVRRRYDSLVRCHWRVIALGHPSTDPSLGLELKRRLKAVDVQPGVNS
jgi:hypothetical protein